MHLLQRTTSLTARALLTLSLPLCLMGAAAAQLKAGSARVEITPPVQPGSQPPTGKYEHEHLFARAIVLDNGTTRVALLADDQSNMADAVWKLALEKITVDLNCPGANVLMSATHTHSPGLPIGPGGGGPGSLPSAEQQRIANALAQAVHEAKGKMQPARMAFGTGMAYLNVNRDAIDPETHLWTQGTNVLAASDKTVAVLKFETTSGQPIGVYVNYAMHPINGYLANFATADFAGAMSRYVEQAYDDKPTVIFSQGASGDQNPLYMRASTNGLASRSGVPITGNVLTRENVEAPLREGRSPDKPMDAVTRDRLERWIESEGDVLGEEVIRVMTNSTRTEETVRLQGEQTDVTCPGRVRTNKGREGQPGTYTDGPDVALRLGVIGIGDVALASVDGEVYNLIAQRLKRQSPMANTVMVTLANGGANSGYIPDDASFVHNSFQAIGSKVKPGCAEDTIANTLTNMIAKYNSGRP